MIGVCKFCKCTEAKACVLGWEDAFTAIPCAWLLDDVCTNPECVEKAYYEARDFVMRSFLEEIAA